MSGSSLLIALRSVLGSCGPELWWCHLRLGVASTGKVQLGKDLGAVGVIDCSHRDSADGSRTFDVVLNIGGMTPLERLRRALTHTGALVIVGGEGDAKWSPGLGRQTHAMLLSPFVPQRLIMVMNNEHHSGLERLASLAADGGLSAFMDRPYPLADTPDTVRHGAADKAAGDVVVTVQQ